MSNKYKKKIHLYSRELLCNDIVGFVEFIFALAFVSSTTKMIVSMNFCFVSFIHSIQNLIKQIEKKEIECIYTYI